MVSRGFAIAVFIITAILVGLLLACIIYFNQIRNGKQVTQSEATSMLIFCSILFVVTLVLWIWSLIAIFFSSSTRDTQQQVVTTKTTQFPGATQHGYTQQQVVTTTSMPPKTPMVGGIQVSQPTYGTASTTNVPVTGGAVVKQTVKGPSPPLPAAQSGSNMTVQKTVVSKPVQAQQGQTLTTTTVERKVVSQSMLAADL